MNIQDRFTGGELDDGHFGIEIDESFWLRRYQRVAHRSDWFEEVRPVYADDAYEMTRRATLSRCFKAIQKPLWKDETTFSVLLPPINKTQFVLSMRQFGYYTASFSLQERRTTVAFGTLAHCQLSQPVVNARLAALSYCTRYVRSIEDRFSLTTIDPAAYAEAIIFVPKLDRRATHPFSRSGCFHVECLTIAAAYMGWAENAPDLASEPNLGTEGEG